MTGVSEVMTAGTAAVIGVTAVNATADVATETGVAEVTGTMESRVAVAATGAMVALVTVEVRLIGTEAVGAREARGPMGAVDAWVMLGATVLEVRAAALARAVPWATIGAAVGPLVPVTLVGVEALVGGVVGAVVLERAREAILDVCKAEEKRMEVCTVGATAVQAKPLGALVQGTGATALGLEAGEATV